MYAVVHIPCLGHATVAGLVSGRLCGCGCTALVRGRAVRSVLVRARAGGGAGK